MTVKRFLKQSYNLLILRRSEEENKFFLITKQNLSNFKDC